jgi:hypothetical protein
MHPGVDRPRVVPQALAPAHARNKPRHSYLSLVSTRGASLKKMQKRKGPYNEEDAEPPDIKRPRTMPGETTLEDLETAVFIIVFPTICREGHFFGFADIMTRTRAEMPAVKRIMMALLGFKTDISQELRNTLYTYYGIQETNGCLQAKQEGKKYIFTLGDKITEYTGNDKYVFLNGKVTNTAFARDEIGLFDLILTTSREFVKVIKKHIEDHKLPIPSIPFKEWQIANTHKTLYPQMVFNGYVEQILAGFNWSPSDVGVVDRVRNMIGMPREEAPIPIFKEEPLVVEPAPRPRIRGPVAPTAYGRPGPQPMTNQPPQNNVVAPTANRAGRPLAPEDVTAQIPAKEVTLFKVFQIVLAWYMYALASVISFITNRDDHFPWELHRNFKPTD